MNKIWRKRASGARIRQIISGFDIGPIKFEFDFIRLLDFIFDFVKLRFVPSESQVGGAWKGRTCQK